ncbi:hypothetical protein T440DRAFT_112280 [Plenodomus tracheiphilus IPT5]|uniref:Uncharacterized protein n=1 Tax=Plenodomus tracheiphilus IPT5 TaxID=1408161 RepID=A0A6A7ALG0_9PLEO|nr:hypothetical protein T440DRAFT_112280 [Plenodomus tracheiphilus IPT5]
MAALQDAGGVMRRDGTSKCCARQLLFIEEVRRDGVFQIAREFSPMASSAFEVGRPTDAEVILSRILEKSIRRSNALDTESPYIIAGLKCFALHADVHIIDHDGRLIDASCIAIMAALQHFWRPDGELFLVDANLAEEQVQQGEVIITMNRHGEICQIAKYGEATVNPLALLQCTNTALPKVKEMGKYIQQKLDEDAKRRYAGGLMAELSSENAR